MSETSLAAVVVLAAGEGTRMKSRTPKVLHTLCGRSLLGHALAAAGDLAPERLVVVVGHAKEEVSAAAVAAAPRADIVVQEQQLGTGHAVRMVIESIGALAGTVIVTYGDMPLLRGQTLGELASRHEAAGNAVTVLTARGDFPGFGRIVRDADGAFLRIVEERDATEAERAVDEFNSGCYAFDGALLADAIKRVTTNNSQHEEYLTDVVEILRGDGHPVGTVLAADSAEIRGVNDRVQLAQARRALNDRILRDWMLAGVTIIDPASTWVDVTVTIGQDAEIGPQTQLLGATVIGTGAKVGPGCLIEDTTVGEDAVLLHAVCRQAEIGPRVTVGPFAYLRPEASIAADAHIGTYVELKKSHIGAGREGAAPHLRRRRDRRRGCEHRRGDDLRQLRRGAQAPHRGWRARLRRQQHGAHRPGRDRRRRLHGGRVGDSRGCVGRRSRDSKGTPAQFRRLGASATGRAHARRRQRHAIVRMNLNLILVVRPEGEQY